MNSVTQFVDVAYLAHVALVVLPIGAAAFIVGRILRRSAARGSIVWGLGVIVTAWGAAVVFEHAWDGLTFGARPSGIPSFLRLWSISPVLDPLPFVAAALGAGWILWSAAARGSVAWGAGVVSLAFGAIAAGRIVLTVLAFLTPLIGSWEGPRVETEVITRDISVEEFDARSAARDRRRIENSRCEDHRRGIEGQNMFGQPLWTFWSATHWCWNGEEVGTDPSASRAHGAYGDSHSPFWSSGFVANASVDDSGIPWEISDRADGIFVLCLPLLQCVQYEYLSIEKRQFSDGSTVVNHPSALNRAGTTAAPLAQTLVPLLPMIGVPLVAGWALLRAARRGSVVWALGIIVSAYGVLSALLTVIAALFFVTVGYSFGTVGYSAL